MWQVATTLNSTTLGDYLKFLRIKRNFQPNDIYNINIFK